MGFFGGFKKLLKPVLLAAGVAAIVATAGAAAPILIGGGSLAAAAGAVSVSSVLAAAAVAGLTTAAGVLLGPKVKQTGFAAQAAVRQAAFNLPIVYGRARVGGGMILYHQSDTNENDLVVAVAVAAHEINAFKKIYAGDVLLYDADAGGNQFPPDQLTINRREGTSTQDTPSIIGSQLSFGGQWALRGVAYYVLRFVNYSENWASGVGAFWAEIEGCADVYDPVTGTRGYTDNWALCVGDYLTRARGGGSLEYGTDINIASLTQAAAISDEIVTEDGGPARRYTLNGVIDTGTSPLQVIRDINAYGVGRVLQRGGEYHIVAGRPVASSGTITERDLAAPVSVESAIEFEDYPDGARGVYTRRDGRYQADSYPAVILSDAPPQPNMLNVDLPMAIEPERAQRLASAVVRQGRRARSIVTGLFSEYLATAVGVIYDLDFDDFGVEGPFEVVSSSIEITADGAQIRVTMLEYSATLFDVGSVTQPPSFADSTLPSPLVVPAPTDVTAVAQTVLLGDGTTQSDILVAWSGVDSLYEVRYDVRWRPAGGEYRSRRTSSTSYLIQGEPLGVGLLIEVRAVNLAGGKSRWVSAGTATPAGDVTPPPVPAASISPVAGGFVFNVAANYVYPADFSHFRLYEGADQDPFGSAAVVMSAGGRQSQFRRDGLSSDVSRSYYITALDHSGNESAPSARLDGTTPSQLTQQEIDQAIQAAEAKADSAEQTAAAAQLDADQAIQDALANQGDIQQIGSRIDAGLTKNVLRNSDFSIGAAVNQWPDFWRPLGDNAPDYAGGLLHANADHSGAAEGMQPLYLRRFANASDQDARILNFSTPDGGHISERGVPVKEGDYIEISANIGTVNCTAALGLFFLDANGVPVGPSQTSASTSPPTPQDPADFDRLWISGEVPIGAERAMLEAIMNASTDTAADAWMFLYRPQMTQGDPAATAPQPYAPSAAADVGEVHAYYKQATTALAADGMSLAQDHESLFAEVMGPNGRLSAEIQDRQTAISGEQQARALAITQTEAALKSNLRGSTEVSQLSLADIEGMLKSSVLIRSVAGEYKARLGVLAGNDGTSTILLDAAEIIATGTITAASGILGSLSVQTLNIAGEAVTTAKLDQESVSRPYTASRGNGGVLFNVNLTRPGYISARVYAVVDVPANSTRQLLLNINGVNRRTVGASAPVGTPLLGVMLIASVAVPMGAGTHSVAGRFSNPQPTPVQLYGDAMGVYA